MTKFS